MVDRLAAHGDERGRFVEIMRAERYPERFVQSNHSRSTAGVLRGLHYHERQADLWYVASGIARAGLADLRHAAEAPATAVVTMDADQPCVLYIPRGVAHGFLAVTDVDLIYLVTNYYDATDENGIAWDDATLAIDWGIDEPILSERDRSNPPLSWDDIPAFS